MKFYFNSLKTRLVVVLLCIALLPGIAVSWIAHHLMFENLREDRITDVELVADAKYDQLVRVLTRKNIQSKALLQNLFSQCGITPGKANPVCVKNLLESNLATEYALGMSLYDNTGGRLNVGESAALQPQDSLLPAGQLARFSGNGTELNRSFFIAVADAKSGYRLVVTYPSSVLESIFFPYPANLGNSGETFLTDGAGYFVTRHKYTSIRGHDHPLATRPVQACLGGQSGKLLDKDYRNADIIHGFRFVPELGSACIMAHITQEEAFAPLRLLEQRLIAALLVCALLLAITAVYLARRIARPVSNLTQVARNIAAGNDQVKADETGSDELAQLAVSFNSMTRKLRESAKLLEAIVEHIPVMVFVKRASDLRIELFNRAGAELTGYPQETVVGKGNYDLWPKEEGDFFTAADRKVLASHEVTEIAEEPITRANGEIRLLQTWKVALRDEHDEPTHMLGISIDITERKQAEQKILQFNAELEQRVAARTAELNDTTTRIQTILNTVADGIITIDQCGRVESLNPAAERQFGYPAAEVIGQNINMLMPDPYHAQHDGYLERYRATGEEHVIGTLREVAGLRRDGSTFPIEVAVSKMQLGDEPHFVGIVRDISARKQAEALRAKIVKELVDFKTALDDHAIVAITDVRGNITYANDKFCTISQYTREELLGQNHRIVNSGHHPQEFFRELWRTISQGHIWQGEIQNRAKDGTLYWVYTTIEPFLDAHGKPVQYIAIRTDITQRKQAEQALHAAKEQAELANRTKDSFLATMSHEIRTPLTGMLGMLEVLSLTPLDHDQSETLKTVWDSSRSLLRIVNDILDWSKIEEGKLELSPQPTSIPAMLQEIVNTYSRVASSKSLVLRQYADARLSQAHIVDALRLSQVLNNFVSNALKFTRYGEIELRAELLEQLDSGERVRFSVKDTGIGIAPEVQQHLFQRYRQESADTARMYGGTGLGLSICRRLVELLDGQLELVSAPGQGSTFSVTFVLPVSAAPGETIATVVPDVAPRKIEPLFDPGADAPLVLAVDDHPTNRDLLARQIKLLGLRAETAENGKVALSLWREGRFALVITDCHMPEMDGYALAREIRRIEAGEKLPHTPLIAWTANALPQEEALCRDAGMDALLVKPANLTQLKTMLAAWLPSTPKDGSQTARAQPPTATHAQQDVARACPIDYAELSQVVSDRAEQIQVLHDFQAHIRADRLKLRELLEQGDSASAERSAHRMKGSSGMVGATELAHACAAIEQAAHADDIEAARAAMVVLEDAFGRLETYLAGLSVAH